MSKKNYHIEQADQLPDEVENLIHQGHVRDEAENGIVCNYKKFALVIKDSEGEIVGALQAYTAFSEIYVDDIWVDPSCRGKNIGRKLLACLEGKFKGKGYNNINLVTSHFQAPGFYKKCGFEVEFVRVNQKNPYLSKTFFIKYFDDDDQYQGVLVGGHGGKK
jgi:ribosomal protein S18 acetylase RimI-like enzyme